MAGLRMFGVAIGIPEPYGSELQDWRKRLGDPAAAWIPPHVTLLPPTEIADERLRDVEEHLLSIAESFEPFDIHLRGSGTFRPVSPVVFVNLVEGISACERLERLVRSGPLARDIRFNYHPHVTVGHEIDEAALDRAFEELAVYDVRFRVWGFTLFEQGVDEVWRPQRDFRFAQPLPGPAPLA